MGKTGDDIGKMYVYILMGFFALILVGAAASVLASDYGLPLQHFLFVLIVAVLVFLFATDERKRIGKKRR